MDLVSVKDILLNPWYDRHYISVVVYNLFRIKYILMERKAIMLCEKNVFLKILYPFRR